MLGIGDNPEKRLMRNGSATMAHRNTQQKALWDDHPANEDATYLSNQLLTYIGNKRSLLDNIAHAIDRVKHRLGKDRLRVFDVFAGSGVVSRFLKAHASLLVSNDFEDYAAVVGRCYLRNRSTVDFQRLGKIVGDLNARVDTETFPMGFIEKLYAPKDENHITAEDRVFYTATTPGAGQLPENAGLGSTGRARDDIGASS